MQFKPEIIAGSDGSGRDDYINRLTTRAATAALMPHFQPLVTQPFEGWAGRDCPQTCKVYVTGWNNPISSSNITTQIKDCRLRAHKSQMKDWELNRNQRMVAERAKGKEMDYDEGFRVVTLVSDEDWEKTKGSVLA
jgi:hypothetical protein